MVCVCMRHVLSKEQTLLVIQVPRHHAIAQRRGSRQVQKLHGQLSVFSWQVAVWFWMQRLAGSRPRSKPMNTYDTIWEHAERPCANYCDGDDRGTHCFLVPCVKMAPGVSFRICQSPCVKTGFFFGSARRSNLSSPKTRWSEGLFQKTISA